MASVSYYYRSKLESSNISIRFIHKELDYVVRTPFVTRRVYWIFRTTEKGKPKFKHKKVEELRGSDAELKLHKLKLLDFKDKIESQFLRDLNGGVAITKEWLKEAVKVNHSIIEGVAETEIAGTELQNEREQLEAIKIKNLLINAVESIYDKYLSNRDELKKFKTTYSWVKSFEKSTCKVYNIIDFNQRFVDVFKAWAITEKEYKLTTVIGHLKRIKRAIEYSYNNDSEDVIKVHKQLRNIKFSNSTDLDNGVDKIVITLNFNELRLIDDLDYSDNEVLQDAQKCILIGCETGLRFSDFNQLKNENLKISAQGTQYWEFKAQKTKKWIQITKTERISQLIDKYGEPTIDYPDNGDITLNRSIKQVCFHAGIKNVVKGDLSRSEKLDDGSYKRRLVRGDYPKFKLISTRTFRRSFATNYYGKIDINHIMRVTGHSTEKMLREYINVSDDSNIDIGNTSMNKFHKEREERRKLKKVD